MRELLLQCLRSVYDTMAQHTLEVFVVDNASSDGSAEAVRAEFPDVHVLENDQNVGFAAANNQAIRLAGGRYVLLLNPDTLAHPGALDTLVDFADAHPDVGIVAPKLLNSDGSLQYSLGTAKAGGCSLRLATKEALLLHRLLPGGRRQAAFGAGASLPIARRSNEAGRASARGGSRMTGRGAQTYYTSAVSVAGAARRATRREVGAVQVRWES